MTKHANATITELQKEIEELEHKWKRALADYQNLEKRISSQQENYIRLASVGVIDKLLPVLDDLKRAGAHLKDNGIELIIKQFQDVLKSEGVEEIEAEGKEFDPRLMDCTEMTEGEKNMVMSVVQSGYTLGDSVIRPAKVKVGAGNNTAKKDTK